MQNYFSQCNTLQEVKELYRTLAKQNHPDKGGNLQTMQEINNQYTKAINTIAKGGKFTAEEAEAEILQAEAYQQAVNKVVHLTGITLQVVGCWLWIGGDTYPVKKEIKEAGFMFAPVKKMWYFRTENYMSRNKTKMSFEDITKKYGCTNIKSKVSYSISA